jgi:hypothetical protein
MAEALRLNKDLKDGLKSNYSFWQYQVELRRKTELILNSSGVVQYGKLIFGVTDPDPHVFEHDLALLDP